MHTGIVSQMDIIFNYIKCLHFLNKNRHDWDIFVYYRGGGGGCFTQYFALRVEIGECDTCPES